MTRSRRVLVAGASLLAASLAGIYLFAALRPKPDTRPFFASLPHHRSLVIAHRGGSEIFPENTIYAFQRAVELGADILEMDVHASAEGVPVVIHDDTVDRTTSGTGRVNDLTLMDLQQLDAGFRFEQPRGSRDFPFRSRNLTIPTLREIFTAFPDIHMIVEIKENNPVLADAMMALVREFEREDITMLASFYHDMLLYFRSGLPQVVTHASGDEAMPFLIASWLHLEGLLSPDYEAFVVPPQHGRLPVTTRRFIQAARNRAIFPIAWTINSPEEMLVLAERDIGGMITDRPDLAHTIVRQAGGQ